MSEFFNSHSFATVILKSDSIVARLGTGFGLVVAFTIPFVLRFNILQSPCPVVVLVRDEKGVFPSFDQRVKII